MNGRQWALNEAIVDIVNDRGADMTTAEVCEVLEHLRRGYERRSRLVRMKDFGVIAQEMERDRNAQAEENGLTS